MSTKKQFKKQWQCHIDITSDDFNNFVQDLSTCSNSKCQCRKGKDCETPFIVPFEDIQKLYIKHREQLLLSALFH